jgi:hypothetical protein
MVAGLTAMQFVTYENSKIYIQKHMAKLQQKQSEVKQSEAE